MPESKEQTRLEKTRNHGGADASTDRTRPESSSIPAAGRLTGRWNPALVAFLDACSKGGQSTSAPTLKIASPKNPVTWDIAGDNKPIADGLAPEKGATLQLYSYADYIAPGAIKSFEEKYSTKVAVSTFNDTDEAITKIRGGNVDYDIYFPSYDQISPAGRRRTGPPDQPQLCPQHQECLAVLLQPLV